MKKDLKELVRRVEDRGWTARRRRSGHLVLEGPDGQKVFCSYSASDKRALRNIERDLARYGLHLS